MAERKDETIEQLLRRLGVRGRADIRIERRGGGAVAIVNKPREPQLIIPLGKGQFGSTPLRIRRMEDGQTVAWKDFPGGGRIVLPLSERLSRIRNRREAIKSIRAGPSAAKPEQTSLLGGLVERLRRRRKGPR